MPYLSYRFCLHWSFFFLFLFFNPLPKIYLSKHEDLIRWSDRADFRHLNSAKVLSLAGPQNLHFEDQRAEVGVGGEDDNMVYSRINGPLHQLMTSQCFYSDIYFTCKFVPNTRKSHFNEAFIYSERWTTANVI